MRSASLGAGARVPPRPPCRRRPVVDSGRQRRQGARWLRRPARSAGARRLGGRRWERGCGGGAHARRHPDGAAATDGAAARTSLLVDNLGRGRKGRNPSCQHPRRAKRILSCPEVRARNAGSRALSARPALNATFGVSVACFTLRFVGCVPPLPFTTSEVLSELQKSQTFIFTYRSSTNPQSAKGRSPRKFQANFAESSNVQSNGAL